MKKINYKVNQWGESVTKCPNGFKTFTSGRPKRVGADCMLCRYRKHVDFDNHVVECEYVKKDNHEKKRQPKTL